MATNIINKIKTILKQDERFLKNEELKKYNKAKKIYNKWLKQQSLGEKNYNKLKLIIEEKEETINENDYEKYYDIIEKIEKTKNVNYIKEGIKQEKEFNKKLKKLENTKVDKIIKIAEKKAEISKITSIKQKWMNIFNGRSYYNELFGQILFHSIIGQLFRNKYIYKGSKKIDYKINIMLIQKSGTGKGEGLRVAKDLISEIQRNIIKRKKEIKTKLKNKAIEIFNYSDFAGEETDAVLLSRFARKENGKGYNYDEVIPGKFERYDFYVYEEAADFIEKRNFAQKATAYFLHILEGKVIEKELEKWNGNVSKTIGKGSLIAVSREISQLDHLLMFSGLFQRCFTILRLMNNDDLIKGIKKASVTISRKTTDQKKERIKYEKDIKELSIEIVNLFIDFMLIEIDIKDPEKINTIIMNFIFELNTRIDLELYYEEYTSIAKSFVARYPEIIMKLMFQNAILRNSNFVEVEDVLNALSLIKQSYEYMENWIQDKVMVDNKKKDIMNKIVMRITKIIRANKQNIILSKKAINCLIYDKYNTFRVSKIRARYLVNKFSSNNRSIFIKLTKDNINYLTLREYKSFFLKKEYIEGWTMKSTKNKKVFK